MYFSNMSLAQEEHTDTGLTDTAADCVWKLFIQNWLSGTAALCAFVTAGLLPAALVRCCPRLHGYPWKKAPGRCPEQDSIPEYRRLIPSHHSLEHVRRGARQFVSFSPICIRKTAPFCFDDLVFSLLRGADPDTCLQAPGW